MYTYIIYILIKYVVCMDMCLQCIHMLTLTTYIQLHIYSLAPMLQMAFAKSLVY